MDTTSVKSKPKRPSKGVAKHNRLVKQEARRTSVPGSEVVKKVETCSISAKVIKRIKNRNATFRFLIQAT